MLVAHNAPVVVVVMVGMGEWVVNWLGWRERILNVTVGGAENAPFALEMLLQSHSQ